MKKWLIPVGIILVCVIFGYREYVVSHISSPRIILEKDLVLLRTSSAEIFGMGRLDSSRANALARKMMSFFSSKGIVSVWDLPLGESREGISFSVQRISDNLVRSISSEQIIWWIGDDFDAKEQVQAVQSGIDFRSDWWIMSKNRLPGFLPLPREGILYSGDRAPSEKTRTFAEEKEIPLISVKETNGLMLLFIDGEWELKVRNE